MKREDIKSAIARRVVLTCIEERCTIARGRALVAARLEREAMVLHNRARYLLDN